MRESYTAVAVALLGSGMFTAAATLLRSYRERDREPLVHEGMAIGNVERVVAIQAAALERLELELERAHAENERLRAQLDRTR
jgi:hypothetical protein